MINRKASRDCEYCGKRRSEDWTVTAFVENRDRRRRFCGCWCPVG